MKVLILTLCLVSLQGAYAGDFEDGAAAYERGDYETAHQLWKPLSEQGDAAAQFSLGELYKRGEGVPKDCKEAMRWYKESAEQGFAEAQFTLGLEYHRGFICAEKDYVKAAEWYRLAAERGIGRAQLYLSEMYLLGRGVPQDYVLAHMWANIAAARLSNAGRPEAEAMRGIAAARMTSEQIAEAQTLAREWAAKYNK